MFPEILAGSALFMLLTHVLMRVQTIQFLPPRNRNTNEDEL